MKLRPYQQKTINMLYDYLEHSAGNPCLVLPTGAGKSIIVAKIAEDTLKAYQKAKVLMLTHSKELISQNAEKLLTIWPNAPLGLYSAGLGRKELFEPIVYAGIQSIGKKADITGHVDLCLIDECHLISHKNEGLYRKFLERLKEINPNMRIVGLTATPYRLGHGLITEGDALFNDLLEPVTIEELQNRGYLSKLKSKFTESHLSTDGVKKRGGEYIESQLQKSVDTDDQNERVVMEVIEKAGTRKAWLFFCTGVDHAQHIKSCLQKHGVTAECVTGKTPKKERDRILNDYKAGKIKALTNANVLTTGFDYPDIDLIAMLRPTMSPGLYSQMVGRGLRLKSHTDHCLVLDFAGVIEQHGPITAIETPNKAGDGDGLAPVKTCPECMELLHLSVMKCPECGYEFEKTEKLLFLRNDDIQGKGLKEMDVFRWHWSVKTSSKTGINMLVVAYYKKDLLTPSVKEYLTVQHEGWAGRNALKTLQAITRSCNVDIMQAESMEEAANIMNKSIHPERIVYKKNNKFFNIIERIWNYEQIERTELAAAL